MPAVKGLARKSLAESKDKGKRDVARAALVGGADGWGGSEGIRASANGNEGKTAVGKMKGNGDQLRDKFLDQTDSGREVRG